MKKKSNKKLVLGVALGLILGTIVTYQAATLIAARGVDYDNTSANLTIGGNSVTNVQDAIDALHTKVSAKTPVSICKTGYTKGIDYGQNYDCIPSSYAITSGYTCERAKWLHKEKCTQTSDYCYADGYYASGSMGTNLITYGKLGTSGANLETGDALDCDVNGNGYIDVDEEGYSLERFYYVSPRWTPGTDTSATSFDTSTAVLIYYSNTYNGSVSNSGAAYATNADAQAAGSTSTDTDQNWWGPVTAIKHLPTTTSWSNVTLKTTTRAIIACNNADCGTASTSTSGGTLPTNFSYAGYAGRLLTVPEIKKAGCDTLSNLTSLGTAGALKACNFLMERTKYADSTKDTYGPWLENPVASNSDIAWNVNSDYRYVRSSNTRWQSRGARPAIEVSMSKILK